MVGRLSPPVMVALIAAPLTIVLFRKWTNSLRRSAASTVTKSMPFKVVEAIRAPRRYLAAVMSQHRDLGLTDRLGLDQDIVDRDRDDPGRLAGRIGRGFDAD